jgi:hypothetical protein
LTTLYHSSGNKAIRYQVTVTYCLFTDLIRLEVVLRKITDP